MTFRSIYAFLTKGMTIQQKAIVGFMSAVVVLTAVFVVVTGRYKDDYVMSRSPLQKSRESQIENEFGSGLSEILGGIVAPAQYEAMVAALDNELSKTGVMSKDETFSCFFADQDVTVAGKVRDFEVTSKEYGTMTIAEDVVKVQGVEDPAPILLSDMGVVSQETVYGFVVQLLGEYKDRLKTDCRAE